MDFHVLSTLLLRGWSVIAGAIVIILIPRCLGAVEQGYFYTFASVLALQLFFELGMNQVVTQLTSHEVAHVAWIDEGQLSGDAAHLDRLTMLAKMLRRWYGVVATSYAICVGLGGAAFFAHHDDLAPSRWLGAWCVTTLATAVNLYLSPSLAMMEGAGRVGEVARMRLYQSMVGYVGLAVVLVFGGGLWAAAMLPIASGAGSAWFLRQGGRLVRWLRARVPQTASGVSWRHEILPFQWRIALSWMCGYFVFQLFTPALFANQGPVQAGRFGMALAIFNSLQSVGMSWVYSRSPALAQYVARGDRLALRSLFLRVLKPSVVFTTLASVAVAGVVWGASRAGFDAVHRLPSIETISLLALTTATNTLIFAMAVFMRAHKEEPMVWQSLGMATLVLAIAHWASRISVELTVGLYFGVTLVVGLPWAWLLFREYWRRP